MIKNQELTILNSSRKCVGKWTRIEGESKSILDYIIVDENEKDTLITMKIDEDKHLTPCTITEERMIPSDHCAIMISFNWLVKAEHEENDDTYLDTSKKNLEKFSRLTNGNRLTKAIQKGNVQEKYSA